jgi:hypothetical protein
MASSRGNGLYRLLTRRWSEEQREGHLESLAKIEADAALRLARATFQTIDTKATGLLTHVSMMIAALGVVTPTIANSMTEGAIIFAEIACYLLIAVASLRCIALFAPTVQQAKTDDLPRWVQHELVLRQQLYNLANRATIWMTIFVFISLPVLFVWHPAGSL